MSVQIEDIQAIVAAEYGLTVAALIGPRRSRHISYPRQVAMVLARKLTKRSTTQIGSKFGGRDHTTVLHAEARVIGRRGLHMVLPMSPPTGMALDLGALEGRIIARAEERRTRQEEALPQIPGYDPTERLVKAEREGA